MPIISSATGSLLYYILYIYIYARDLSYLRDQATWTSSQQDKAHTVTVLVLTVTYLLLLQTKEQMEKDWMN